MYQIWHKFMVWKILMIIKKTELEKKWKKKIYGEKNNFRWFYQYNLGCVFEMPHFVIIRFFSTINLFHISYTFFDTDSNGTNKTYKYIYIYGTFKIKLVMFCSLHWFVWCMAISICNILSKMILINQIKIW